MIDHYHFFNFKVCIILTARTANLTCLNLLLNFFILAGTNNYFLLAYPCIHGWPIIYYTFILSFFSIDNNFFTKSWAYSDTLLQSLASNLTPFSNYFLKSDSLSD